MMMHRLANVIFMNIYINDWVAGCNTNLYHDR